MRLRYFLLLMIFVAPSVTKAQDNLKQWVLDNYTKREVMIKMRDGISLFTAIYEPKDDSQKHPILVERSPYTCSPYGEAFGDYLWERETEYVKHSYILVFQDVRGKNRSEGDYEDVRPVLGDPTKNYKKTKHTDETTDTYDTVDWLVKNTRNNNGNVGFWGVSNPGFYATEAGICGHPAVKAVSPQAPVTNWWMGDDIHHNGAFMLMDSYVFFPWFSRHDITAPFDDSRLRLRDVDAYTKFLEAGAIRNLTARIDSCTLWNTVISNPDYNAYWREHDASAYILTARPAVMVIGGEFDAEDCWGALQTYQAFRKAKNNAADVHFVYGPWSHGGWRGECSWLGDIFFGDTISAASFHRDIEYPFFAYYLEGKGARPCAVRAFSTGENRWNNLSSWPLVGTDEATAFYLHADGRIDTTAPSTAEMPDTYTSDPSHPVPYQPTISSDRGTTYLTADQRFASYRPDVLTYQTSALADTMRLAGPIDVDLSVAVSTTDADFVVKVIDVFPDGCADASSGTLMSGYEMLVRGDVMRGRYRNNPSHPEAFTPNEPTEVRFTLNDVCHTFLPGHRLMVQIQSSWFPLVDRNPQQFVDIYHCPDSDFIPAEISINHSAEHPSLLRLPVVVRNN